MLNCIESLCFFFLTPLYLCLYAKCCYNQMFSLCFYWITILSLVKYFAFPFFFLYSSFLCHTEVLCWINCSVTCQWKSPFRLPDPKFKDLEIPSPMTQCCHQSNTSSPVVFSTVSLCMLQKKTYKTLSLCVSHCCLSSSSEILDILGFSLIGLLCEVYCMVRFVVFFGSQLPKCSCVGKSLTVITPTRNL